MSRVTALMPDKFAATSPQLAAFVDGGGRLVAAFLGPGGLHAVYLHRLGTFFIATMADRPVLIEPEDPTGLGCTRESAVAIAKALSAGVIAAVRTGARQCVPERDIHRAYEARIDVVWSD